jgi:membrane protein implicated in regulation of membrane protease activity
MYWLILFVVLIVIEIVTLGLTTIWFAGGALTAFVAAVLGAPLWVQIVLFFLVSILLLFVTRPIALKYLNRNRTKTNAESLIDKTGVVTAEINNLRGEGSVIVNGQEWTARAVEDEQIITKDQLVVIKEIIGVKLIVEVKREEIK